MEPPLATALRPSNLLELATTILLLATPSMLNSAAAQVEQATSVCTTAYDDFGKAYYPGGNEYMCVDWSVGSAKMEAAEDAYKARMNGESVVFGMGSYGLRGDYNMGKCYMFDVSADGGSTTTKVIGQVTNFGGDIKSGQFDMQMGGGGFGVWNACAYGAFRVNDGQDPCVDDIENQNPSMIEYMDVESLFLSVSSQWGKNCGGQTHRSGCSSLPSELRFGSFPDGAPSLQELCYKSYDKGLRINNGNPVISNGFRIYCPDELVAITQLRKDEDTGFIPEEMVSGGFLTSTMDCCAPAGSYSDNTRGASSGSSDRLVPCQKDGYTRSSLAG